MKSNVWQSLTDEVSRLLALRQHESELVFTFTLGPLWYSFNLLENIVYFVSDGHKKHGRTICKC